MQRNGMSSAELAAFHTALAHPVRVSRTRILIMDLDHNVERDVQLPLLDGMVSVNVDAEGGGEDVATTRSLTMQVADPTGSLGLEPTSVGEYAVFPQQMVQVRLGFKVAGVWRDTAAHTGPLLTVTPADGGAVDIAAQGKEALCAGSQKQRSWKAGTPKTDIIKALLRGTGEKDAYIEVPHLPVRRIPKRYVLLDTDNPWRKARALARSMGYELFYDGRGVAVMRRQRTTPVVTYGAGMVLGDLVAQQEAKPIYNTFVVVGGKPKGSKTRVSSGFPLIELAPDHEWSARNLGRGGEPRRLVQRETNDQLTRKVDCRYRAFQLRDQAVRLTTEIPAEVVCMPHLDELDRVRVVAASGSRTLLLKQFTIPLAGQSQALGTVVRTGSAFVPKKPKPKKKAAKKAASRSRDGRLRRGGR